MIRDVGDVGRRNFLQIAAGGIGLAAVSSAALAAPSEDSPDVLHQPSPDFEPDLNTADIVVETLIAWGATHAFGIVGDGINTIIEALRKRQDRIRYIGVRHEEAAAFMASGFAKHTGRLGVCVGATGPGAVHLLNGLYDAHMDGAPVVALTGMTFHDLIGTRYQQGIDTTKLMEPVALYNVEVTGPQHAVVVANRACELSPIDFVAFAEACGADGFRCERPEEVRPAIEAALRSRKAAIVEAIVDAGEKPADPEQFRV